MGKTTFNSKLKQCEVIIETEIERERNMQVITHYFKLVKSRKVPKYSKKYSASGLLIELASCLKYHYYILWGNADDEEMGILEVLTPNGNQIKTISGIHSKFFEVIKKSENMNFRKLYRS